MSTPPDDRELEDFLSGGSRVSQSYRASSQEEPPAALDARIRAEAARDIERDAGLRRRTTPSALRWMRPAALAATLLLSVAVVVELGGLRGARGPGVPGGEGGALADRSQAYAPIETKPVMEEPPPPVTVDLAPLAAHPQMRMPDAAVSAPAPARRAREESLEDVEITVNSITAEQVARAPTPEQEIAESAAPATTAASSVAAGAASANAYDGAAIERAVVAARARITPVAPNDSAAPTQAAAKREGRFAQLETGNSDTRSANERLREIVQLHEQGNVDGAAAALAAFARDFPDDPIAALLKPPAE